MATNSNSRPALLILHPSSLIPALLCLPFLLAFLFVALSRLFVPFELEWNEGQSAEQALRFALGQGLYPDPSAGWVPYMYAPLYHMVLGAIFQVAGPHLAWGRLISFASSLAAAAGIGWIVRDRTRDAAAAWFGALLYFAYFKPTGFWYDIARIDAFAFALTVWGMGVALSRDARSSRVAIGLALLFLATLAKQTAAPVAVWCGLVLLARRHPAMRWLAPLLVLAAMNFAILFPRAGNERFWHYAVVNATRHASDLSVYRSIDGAPPRVWAEGLCHVWLFVAAIAAWLFALGVSWLRGLSRGTIRVRSILDGTMPLAVCVALLAWGSLGGFAKFGGYRNNFLPLFGGVCLLAALALADAFRVARSERRPLRRAVMHVTLAGIVVAQLLFPAPSGSLLYDPRAQLPHRDSAEMHRRLTQWLEERHAAGEPALVAHHQWYGLLAGHPSAPSVDMVRCATWAGDPVPPSMIEAIDSGRYRWLVLDAEPKYDWLAPGVPEAIARRYGPATPLPACEGLDFRAMAPLTGAPVRPAFVLERLE